MDDFLKPEICQQLHQELINQPGWHCQQHSEHPVLSNMNPKIETIFHIAGSLKEHCSYLLTNYELVEHWALMYPKNGTGTVHSDTGALTLNIWLTPDQYNLDASGGGLVFFDVKRGLEATPDKPLAYFWSEQYLKDTTRGQKTSVHYRCNRALLFDAKTFHQTDTFCFANTKPESYRINLSLTFDDPAVYRERIRSFRGE